MIAEIQLAELISRSRAALVAIAGDPRDDLVMTEDGQAYRLTTVVLVQPDGALHLHVGVDSSGWATGAVVVRTARLPATSPPRSAPRQPDR